MNLRRDRTTLQWITILFLLLGGFIAGVGWLAGVALLWMSSAWKLREKLIGTLVIPGGLGLWAVWCLLMHHLFWEGNSTPPAWPLQLAFYMCCILAAVAPLVTAWWLARCGHLLHGDVVEGRSSSGVS